MPITTAKGVLQHTIVTLQGILKAGQLCSTQQRPASGETTVRNLHFGLIEYSKIIFSAKQPIKPQNPVSYMGRLFRTAKVLLVECLSHERVLKGLHSLVTHVKLAMLAVQKFSSTYLDPIAYRSG